jgi:hypothetical protein
MAKKKNKANRNNTGNHTGNTCAASTTANPESTTVEVTGVLADDAVISTAIIADQDIKTAVCTVADDLQKHIDSTFSLRRNGIKINTDNVLIPGEQMHLFFTFTFDFTHKLQAFPSTTQTILLQTLPSIYHRIPVSLCYTILSLLNANFSPMLSIKWQQTRPWGELKKTVGA